MSFGVVRTEIAEGHCLPEGNWWLCVAKVYGYRNGELDRDDYQGWIALLKTPAFEWFPDGITCLRPTWAQMFIHIRHVYLTPPRRGLNGSGWQGWRWSTCWQPIEI